MSDPFVEHERGYDKAMTVLLVRVEWWADMVEKGLDTPYDADQMVTAAKDARAAKDAWFERLAMVGVER